MEKRHNSKVSFAAMMVYIYIFGATPVLAQDGLLTLKTNGILANDRVVKQVLPYSYEGAGGDFQTWDFSGLDPEGDDIISYVLRGDSLMGVNDNSVSYIIAGEDGMWQAVYEDAMEHIAYNEPMLAMRFPLAYGDRYSSPFEGEGRYCGTHHIRHFGTVSIKADGQGMLVLSKSDTLRNVVRVQTITTAALRVSKDSLSNDNDNQKQVITERYGWYAEGFRYPVFETVTSTTFHDLKPVATRQYALRCLPGMQLTLNDSINSEIRKSAANQAAQDIFTYEVSESQNQFTIRYNLEADATIRVIVADAQGMLHKSLEETRPAGQGYELRLDCSSLRRGQYAIYINVNGTVYNHKISVK